VAKDERLPGSGNMDDVSYSINRIDDTEHGFTLEFLSDNQTHSVTFARRPNDREQMEYAHACVQGYLSGTVNPGEVPPAAIL
jgi:hypothetical protein